MGVIALLSGSYVSMLRMLSGSNALPVCITENSCPVTAYSKSWDRWGFCLIRVAIHKLPRMSIQLIWRAIFSLLSVMHLKCRILTDFIFKFKNMRITSQGKHSNMWYLLSVLIILPNSRVIRESITHL